MPYKPIRKSYRSKPRRWSIKWWRTKPFWFIVLTGFILATAVYNIFFSPFFQIGEVLISGNKKIDLADLYKVINPYLSKNMLLWETKSIFFVSPTKIEKIISENFPSVTQIKVERKWPDGIKVFIQEREAEAIWCKEPVCFYIDKNGVIFEEVLGNFDKLVIQNKEYKEDLFLGKQVLSKEKIGEVFILRDSFKNELQIDIKEVIFVSPERIDVLTPEGWEAYFNFPVDNLQWQITRLKIILQEEIPVERRPELEYIDLRFGKVYYKYREF